MHTPGHALLNLAVLGSIVGHEAAVLAGAVVPDVPIVILYLREKARGTPDDIIWSQVYQRRHWLAIIHGAHSLPLGGLATLLSFLFASPALVAFFCSMSAHALCDLPVHAHDAHRHFFPFSSYRFISPISYWDPRYHGRTVAWIEALLIAACSVFIYCVLAPRWTRLAPSTVAILLLTTNLWYAQSFYRSFVRR